MNSGFFFSGLGGAFNTYLQKKKKREEGREREKVKRVSLDARGGGGGGGGWGSHAPGYFLRGYMQKIQQPKT
jgi:hypothetical protein